MQLNSISNYSNQAFGMAIAGKNLQNLIQKARKHCSLDDVLTDNCKAIERDISSVFPSKTLEVAEVPDNFLFRLFSKNAKRLNVYADDKYIGGIHLANKSDDYGNLFVISQIAKKNWFKSKCI